MIDKITKLVPYKELEVFSIFRINTKTYVKFSKGYMILNQDNIPSLDIGLIYSIYLKNTCVLDTKKRWSIMNVKSN